ncbi:MAG: hypothetical protein A2Y24_01495 [Clostridiales bacterium GWE2_32_10]|nr:MAG: hypothetical protein A2Y24_01495 [Clostridiales bacterium GWE2_32_10]
MKEILSVTSALSDEIRLRIINILFESDLYVCEMVDILELPQSTVSRHLTILKNANIVEDTKNGLWVKYALIENRMYDNIIKALVKEEILNTQKCKDDLVRVKARIEKDRGCKGNCKEV